MPPEIVTERRAQTYMSSDQDKIKFLGALQRWKPWLIGAAALAIAFLLGHTLKELFAEFSYQDLLNAIRSTTTAAVAMAVLSTLISYLALTGYDYSSVRYVGANVSYGVAAQTAFISYALSNTIGLGV